MKKKPCKNCYGKGRFSVMESIQRFDDFVVGEGFKTEPRVYARFCNCPKGKRMELKARKDGYEMVGFNLYEWN